MTITMRVVSDQSPRSGTTCESCGTWIGLVELTEGARSRRTWWEVSHPAWLQLPEHTLQRCRALRSAQVAR